MNNPTLVDDEALPIKEVATMFRMSERNIHRLVASGRFPKPIRIGRSLRWLKSVLSEFLYQQNQQQNGSTHA